MALAKYKIEKFDGRNNFSLWRVKMWTILVQQNFLEVLSCKDILLESISKDEKSSKLRRIVSYNFI